MTRKISGRFPHITWASSGLDASGSGFGSGSIRRSSALEWPCRHPRGRRRRSHRRRHRQHRCRLYIIHYRCWWPQRRISWRTPSPSSSSPFFSHLRAPSSPSTALVPFLPPLTPPCRSLVPSMALRRKQSSPGRCRGVLAVLPVVISLVVR